MKLVHCLKINIHVSDGIHMPKHVSISTCAFNLYVKIYVDTGGSEKVTYTVSD